MESAKTPFGSGSGVGNANNQQMRALLVGLDKAWADTHFAGMVFRKIEIVGYEFLDTLEAPSDPNEAFQIVFMGKPPKDYPLLDKSQAVIYAYPKATIFMAYYVKDPDNLWDRHTLLKAGFKEVFFLPLDKQLLTAEILETISVVQAAKHQFSVIRRSDLFPTDNLPFSVFIYLPRNHKYVVFAQQNSELTENQITNLVNQKIEQVYLHRDDMIHYFTYMSKRIQSMTPEQLGAHAQSYAQLKVKVRDFITNLFCSERVSPELGKEFLTAFTEAVHAYLTANEQIDIYDRICLITGQVADTYSHALNTCLIAEALASLFGLQTIDELMIAALMHDVGLTQMPEEMMQKPPEKWTNFEKDLYQKHPKISVDMVKSKKILVSELTHKIMMQHHERWDGTGFPKQVSGVGNRIALEAMLLSFADQFDELTSLDPQKPSMSPAAAFHYLKNRIKPDATFLDPKLIATIGALFPAEPEPDAALPAA
jgi:HD-GYP domain-containing protein (c-di-GMP phosphodiesterase class II)